MSTKQSDVIVLKKTLTPIHLWAIGVGIVISGNYFGWNFGLAESGYIGMLIATLIMAVLYLTMSLGIAELSTIMPHAGGPYAFARRAMGPYVGFITGIGVVLQYVIAAPTVAIGIGAYISFMFPSLSTIVAAAIVYAIFIIVHMIGLKEYARLEMLLVFIAIALLALMYIVGLPQVSFSNLGSFNGAVIPGGIEGLWAALPYAMWLFLAIEMLPMLAEETRDVKKDMPRGLLSGMLTLFILSLLTTTVTIGIAGIDVMSTTSDPLPAAIAVAFGQNHWLTQLLATVGIIGLIASFSGVILAYSRQVFALSRAGYLPKFLSMVHPKRKTPYMALIAPSIIGLVLVTLVDPSNLILIVTFGSLVSYIMMNLSVLILRKKEPHLVRSFKTPFYPLTPILSLILCFIAIFASFFTNITFFFISIGIFVLATVYYFVWARHRINTNAPEEQVTTHTTEVTVSPLITPDLEVTKS